MASAEDRHNRIGSRAENHRDRPEAADLRAHLFTVRLWSEVLGDGRTEWRGQIQHVTNREKCYFREWSTLVSFLERKLSELHG